MSECESYNDYCQVLFIARTNHQAVFNESKSQIVEKCNIKLIAEFDNFNPPLLALVAHYSRLREKINVSAYKH